MKNKKWLLTIVMLLVSVIMALFSTGCKGSYELTEFVVESDSVKTEYVVGEEVDFSDVNMYALFNDGSKQEIPLNKVKVFLDGVDVTGDLSKITSAEGMKKVLLFKYSDQTVRFEIDVYARIDASDIRSIALDLKDVKTTYFVGESVDFKNLRIIAKDKDGNQSIIPYNDVKIYFEGEDVTSNLNKLTEAVGQKNIRVFYEGFESETLRLIVKKEVSSISLDTSKLDFDCKVGETVALNNLKVKATYKDNTQGELAYNEVNFYLGETKIAATDLTKTAGEKTVTVEYDGKKANFTLKVENYVKSIALTTAGVDLEYDLNGAISVSDFSGVKINVTWADETDASVKKSLSLTDTGVSCLDSNDVAINWAGLSATEGSKKIVVQYGGVKAEFTIDVVSDTMLKELQITAPEATYTAGGTVSLSGLTFKAIYKDEYTHSDETITLSQFAAKGVKVYLGSDDISNNYDKIAQTNKLGEVSVSVRLSYEGKTGEFIVKVNNPITLTLDTTNITKEYDVKDVPSFKNLGVKATPTYGTEQTVSVDSIKFLYNGAEISDYSSLTTTAGTKTVTVSYAGATATFNINVTDWVENLTATGKIECDYGATEVSLSGITVKAIYASGEEKDVTSQATNDYNIGMLNTAGEKTITYTYAEKTATVTLIVYDVLDSIRVDASSLPAAIAFNGQVDLTGIKVWGTYAYGGEKVVKILNEGGEGFLPNRVVFYLVNGTSKTNITSNLNEISMVSGERTIELHYTERNVTKIAEFIVTVKEPKKNISMFIDSRTMEQYKGTVNAAEDGDKDGVFFANDVNEYIVGDDNAFKYLPHLEQVVGEDIHVAAQFYADSTIYVKENGEYVALTKEKVANTEYRYTHSYNGTVYVTEDSNKNEYTFANGALVGKYFKISVLPSADWYVYDTSDISAKSCEIKIVDGFNVTAANQLCVMDNSGRTEWNTFKNSLGLAGVAPNAIVLHNNVKITSKDIPAEYQYTVTNCPNYTYTDKDGNEKTVTPEQYFQSIFDESDWDGLAPTTFLYDKVIENGKEEHLDIYRHTISNGNDFAIYGNYFDLNAEKLPLVAAFDKGEPYGYYGGDFSNAALIHIYGQGDALQKENDELFRFENLAVKGNANIYDVKIAENADVTQGKGNPVFAGGTIFIKVERATATFENVLADTFFIPFFANTYSIVNYNRTKCTNSYQNAMYVWNQAEVNITSSYFKYAGGPLIIMNHVDPDESGAENRIPVVNISSDSVMKSAVTGLETWFSTVGGELVVTQLRALDALFNQAGKTLFDGGVLTGSGYDNSKGKMNILALLMRDATNADDVLNCVQTQGQVAYQDKACLDRMASTDLGQEVRSCLTKGIVINIGENVFYLVQSGENVLLYDSNGNIGESVFNAFGVAVATTNYICLNQGGMGLMLECYDLPSA